MTTIENRRLLSKKTVIACLKILLTFLIVFIIIRLIYHIKSVSIETLLPTLSNTVDVSSNIQAVINTYKTSASFICNKTQADRFPVSSTTPSNLSFDVFRKASLQQYCKIVPIPRSKWSKAQQYTEQDIAFVIFTASNFFHNRATAVRDTWLSRVTNYYFLSATTYPHLPVTVVPGAGEDKLSNMKKLFYGLQIIYRQQMDFPLEKRQKWFYIIGCDTFILPHHLLKRIDGLDSTQSHLVGGHSGKYPCLGRNRTRVTIEYPSGGAGFFFSMKLLQILQPHLTNYVENVWPRTSEDSDVALTCLVKELGVSYTKQVAFWAHPPAWTLHDDGRKTFHEQPEPNNYHYVKPDEMYALDEFYVHQHFDRLVNDQNWEELVEFGRRFIASHYVLLRKKRQECTLPVVGKEAK